MKKIMLMLLVLSSLNVNAGHPVEDLHMTIGPTERPVNSKDFKIFIDDLITGICYEYSGDLNPEICKTDTINCYDKRILTINESTDQTLTQSQKAVKTLLLCTTEQFDFYPADKK